MEWAKDSNGGPGMGNSSKTHPIVTQSLPAWQANLGLPATSFQKDGSLAAKYSIKNPEWLKAVESLSLSFSSFFFFLYLLSP